MVFCLLVSLVIIIYVCYILYRHFFPTPNINPNGKYVLISGCDSGLGLTLAIQLDKQGFNVLAGVLLPNSVDSLKSKLSSNATVFHLDITKQEDIDAAFELVQNKTNTLHALVNNAGLGIFSYIDWITMESLRKVMDVNFFGHVAMTKTFLPLLIKKQYSRVVNITSMFGYGSVPSGAAYCGSKYALESFSDCLRREMSPWNLHVSIIQPGTMKTNFFDEVKKSVKDIIHKLPKDLQQRWGDEFLNNYINAVENDPLTQYADSPEKVVRSIEHAVRNKTPQIRYRPGWQSKVYFCATKLLPAWVVDQLFELTLKALPAGVKNQLN